MPDLLDNPQLAGAPDFMSRAGALLQAAIDAGYSQEDAYNMYMAPARLAQRVLEESSPSPRATIQQPKEFAPVTDADTEKMTNAVNSYYASVKAGQDPSLAMTRVMVGPAREVMRAGWKRQEAAKQKAVEDSAEFNRLNREYILGQKELAMSEKDRRTTEEAAAGIMRDELGSGNDPNVVMSEIGPHLSGEDFRYLNGLVMKQAGKKQMTPLEMGAQLRKAGETLDYYRDPTKGPERMSAAALGSGLSTNAINQIVQSGFKQAVSNLPRATRNEVRRVTKDGRTAIFDADTREFLRYAE